MTTNTDISPTQVTSIAPTTLDIPKGDRAAFLDFYTDGNPDTIYVPVADFLAWKGVYVKSEDRPDAPVAAKSWSLAFREIATNGYNSGGKLRVKRSVSGDLLFDLDFLLESFDSVLLTMRKRVFGC